MYISCLRLKLFFDFSVDCLLNESRHLVPFLVEDPFDESFLNW